MDYTDRLRHLAINERAVFRRLSLRSRSRLRRARSEDAAARTARSVDHGRYTVPSHGAQADAAADAGATAAEIVDVLVGVVPIVCLPYVAAAAPKLAMALGYDTEAGLEHHRHEVGNLVLLARYFARRVTTIAINASTAKTTAAMPIFFICSHLPKD